jgi:hypothetical protein
MKTICMVLLAIGGATLSGEAFCAAPSGQTTRGASSAISAKPNADATARDSRATPADENDRREKRLSTAQLKGRDSISSQSLNQMSQRETVHRSQHPLVESRMTAKNDRGPQQLSQLQPAGVQKGIPMHISASNARLATRPFRANRPNTQLLGNLSHRGINPPAISGSATAHRLDNAAINGSEVHHKP